MRCRSVGSLIRNRSQLGQLATGQEAYNKHCNHLVAPRRLVVGTAESVSGKNSGKGEEKQENDPSWVAKFFPGSDEDEPQWEKEPSPIKEKVIVLLEREKQRSKFWGRLAVLALGAVLLSERLSGKGIVTALNMATGVPIMEIEPALGLVVVAILAVGLLPAFRKTEKDETEKPTALDSFQITTGRLACVALAGTILAEATTGKGILALLNINTGVEITEIEGGLTFILLLLFTAGTADEKDKEDGRN